LELFAPAKINLTLDVLGKREDGYHEIETIMQTIALGDTVQLVEAPHIEVESDHPQMPMGRNNIAVRAAELFCQKTGITKGVRIRIKKRIPIAAGLAGGSTDAAAVLRGLNKLWESALPNEVMLGMAAELGSDVAFCLRGGTALGKGRGEQVAVLSPLPRFGVIIVKMPFAVSTKEVYQRFQLNPETKPTTEAMIQALQCGKRRAIMEAMGNMLEQVTLTMHPEIAQVKALLREAGAEAVLMSGSGPTVFALTETGKEAQQVVSRLPNSWEVLITETCRGPDAKD
jgi:4-diphosphocytidyl-2-C-methyl-D-erythritol kinase